MSRSKSRDRRVAPSLPVLALPVVAVLVAGVVTSADEAAPPALHRWTVTESSVRGHTLAAAAGHVNARIAGTPRRISSRHHALVLDGKTHSINVTRDLAAVKLPARELSVEARVLLMSTSEWGGVVSALQDNGDFERGFLLGTKGDRFCFALATKGKGRLTYLEAGEALRKGVWHHVVGVYDGTTMSLWVDGKQVASSAEQSGEILHAPSGFLELGSYRDDNEYYRSRGLFHDAAIHDRALTDAEIRDAWRAKRRGLPDAPRDVFGPFAHVHGPFARMVTPTRLRIEWETVKPTRGVVTFGEEAGARRDYASNSLAREHAIEIDSIARETKYRYQIQSTDDSGESEITASYVFDSTFNYAPPTTPRLPVPYDRPELQKRYAARAAELIDRAGTRAGYVLILGTVEGRLAYELAMRSDLKVVVLESDAARIGAARDALDRAGLYGDRVAVHTIDALGGNEQPADLGYGPYFANIVTSGSMLETGRLPGPAAAIVPVVRPCGGVLALEAWTDLARVERKTIEAWSRPVATDLESGAVSLDSSPTAVSWTWRRGRLPGARDWTHQYGLPDNASCSGDALVGGKLRVLWWGRPGPRPMPDRGPRNPAPVSANGRLYVQGNRTLFGLDAYNGTILWAYQIPTMRRANMPRASSNMAASDTHLFVAIGSRCVAFNGQTGERERSFDVKGLGSLKGRRGRDYEWGYLGLAEGRLVGTASRLGSNYSGDQGEWYEEFKGSEIGRVTSDSIFVLDPETSSKPTWHTSGGVVLNSTITVADGTVYFIESRSEAARKHPSGRLFEEVQSEQYLVALDLATGKKKWEKYFDFSQCQFMTYMSYAGGKLLVTGSDRSKEYHTYAFDTTKRDLAWEHHAETLKTHHSGHLMHPVIVGKEVFFNKHTFDLDTGEVKKVDPFDYHGCGAMAASSRAIFHRFEFHGMLDLETGKRTEFLGIRGGCWLGQIPTGGMLLAPESSSGCSCTHSIQTSVGYVPEQRR